MYACDYVGMHVTLADGKTCGVSEWLSCEDCGNGWWGDPHKGCPVCGVTSNLGEGEWG